MASVSFAPRLILRNRKNDDAAANGRWLCHKMLQASAIQLWWWWCRRRRHHRQRASLMNFCENSITFAFVFGHILLSMPGQIRAQMTTMPSVPPISLSAAFLWRLITVWPIWPQSYVAFEALKVCPIANCHSGLPWRTHTHNCPFPFLSLSASLSHTFFN